MKHLAILLLLALPAPVSAQRTVEKNRRISTALPNAEQHFFVELDGTRIKRLLWIQFEGYHASNTNTYNYRDETVTHSGRTWHRRISTMQAPTAESRPDSDGARMRAFLRAKAWTMGPEIMLERLVWLLDAPPRNELMIIYMEDRIDPDREAFHRRSLGSFTVRDR